MIYVDILSSLILLSSLDSLKAEELEVNIEFYLQSVSTKTGDSNIITATQGAILTLWCAARGSENIKFQWFKKGYPIDISLTDREIYTSVVISRSEEITRSILSLDSVTPYDRGEDSASKMKNKH
ncbi:hypothetical protein KUTeg_016634 [Tegillarca granosa]|uniref:Ig-like domain-containing protein n=1 Tax=Tegillarca granosa TaxID=220873 RepID=A0ABQ9EMC7_TEGGR|nr:hypothetical protein KUTeg_016634 [Tegillarca granosa]